MTATSGALDALAAPVTLVDAAADVPAASCAGPRLHAPIAISAASVQTWVQTRVQIRTQARE
jgi:hypothetical protein